MNGTFAPKWRRVTALASLSLMPDTTGIEELALRRSGE